MQFAAVPGGICIGIYFRNGLAAKTTKIRAQPQSGQSTLQFAVSVILPTIAMQKGSGNAHTPSAPHSMSTEDVCGVLLKPICPENAVYQT